MGAPPPAASVWHCPHTPIATTLFPLELAKLPQNGVKELAPVPALQLPVSPVPVHYNKTNNSLIWTSFRVYFYLQFNSARHEHIKANIYPAVCKKIWNSIIQVRCISTTVQTRGKGWSYITPTSSPTSIGQSTFTRITVTCRCFWECALGSWSTLASARNTSTATSTTCWVTSND